MKLIFHHRLFPPSSLSLNKEIQYRDERIQILQAEMDHLRQNTQTIVDNKYKAQNLILSNKVEDLRAKLIEECQKSETLKMQIRLKTNQCQDLQEALNQHQKQIDELSNKFKSLTDQHRHATVSFNNESQIKQQQIDQLGQHLEQINAEKVSLENEHRDLQRICQSKEKLIEDLQAQVRQLQRDLSSKDLSTMIPIESTVSKITYDQLDQELIQTRKRLEIITMELKMKENLIDQHKDDLRSLKQIHDQHWQDHLRTTTSTVEQLQTEIRSLKRLIDEKNTELEKQSLELRSCQKRLTIEQNRINGQVHEQQQLRLLLDQSNRDLEQLRAQIERTTRTNEQLEQNINDFHEQKNVTEKQLMETIALIDQRNQTIKEFRKQIETVQISFNEKQQELIDKQKRLEELENNVIEKGGQIAQLTETLEADQLKTQHRDKRVEEHANKVLTDIQTLQAELKQCSQSLLERERINSSLIKQIQLLNEELRLKNDQFQKMQNNLEKQLSKKQDQLIRYDRTLQHQEIQLKYAKEECSIQEKEIQRLNHIEEEQNNRIEMLQQHLIKLHQEKETISNQYDQCDGDLRTFKVYREDENRRSKEEIERLDRELTTLKTNESVLIQTISDLKENLAIASNEIEDLQEQNDSYKNQLENFQKLLYEETETSSKASATVNILTQQVEDAEQRANQALDPRILTIIRFKWNLVDPESISWILIESHVSYFNPLASGRISGS